MASKYVICYCLHRVLSNSVGSEIFEFHLRQLNQEAGRADASRHYGFYIDGDIAKLPGGNISFFVPSMHYEEERIFLFISNVSECHMFDKRKTFVSKNFHKHLIM